MGNACSCRGCSKIPVLLAWCMGTGTLEGTESLCLKILNVCENLFALKSPSEAQRAGHEQKS